jgi:uncharacterized protein (DUF4415 family)
MKENSMKKESRTNWKRIDDMEDIDIDTSDIAPLDKDFFENATLRLPDNKRPITIRIDADVLEWFQSQGRGYQTRMNAILRLYMEAQAKKQ